MSDALLAKKPAMVRLEPELHDRLCRVAGATKHTPSAVIRAAVRLGLRALEVKPEMVRQVEAGTMDGGTMAEFVTRFALVCGYHVNPQTAEEQAAAQSNPLMDHLAGVSAGVPQHDEQRKPWLDFLRSELPKLLSSEPTKSVLRQTFADFIAETPLLPAALPAQPPAPAKSPKRKAGK